METWKDSGGKMDGAWTSKHLQQTSPDFEVMQMRPWYYLQGLHGRNLCYDHPQHGQLATISVYTFHAGVNYDFTFDIIPVLLSPSQSSSS